MPVIPVSMKPKEYPFSYCLNPQRIVNPYNGETLVVPCGHCEACAQVKSSRYVFQLNCECEASMYNYFVTLTFANRFIPRMVVSRNLVCQDKTVSGFNLYDYYSGVHLGKFDYSKNIDALLEKCHLFGSLPYLDKTHAQRFIKRVREKLRTRGLSVRFFLSGEYSPNTFRPHFHIIFSSDCSELNRITAKLGDFPEWTWSRNEEFLFTKESPVTLLEQVVRESWPYGIVDFQTVESGQAAKYVAGYVNGSCNLPSCFLLPGIRPFCTHSQRLGRNVFFSSLRQIFEGQPRELIKRSLFLADDYREVTLPVHYFSSVFPRCPSFNNRTHESIVRYYRIFREISACYGLSEDSSCWQVSKFLVKSIIDSRLLRIPLKNEFLSNLIDELLPYDVFLQYQKRYSDASSVDLKAALLHRCYTFLAPSSIVLKNCISLASYYKRCRCLWNTPQKVFNVYISRLIEFHSVAQQFRLTSFYESMSKYSPPDLDCTDDYIYFYNNGEYTMEELKETYIFREFASNVHNIAREHVKHKYQNDLNQIFCDNG